jgi:DNA-binding response OmpR family regulator
MAGKRVLSVGQCQTDNGSLRWMLRSRFDAEVVAAANGAEAMEKLDREHIDLVLVNRVLDADGSPGVDVVRKVKQASAVPVMLVSNHADAQAEAVAAGAVPGFGKSALAADATFALLSPYLS